MLVCLPFSSICSGYGPYGTHTKTMVPASTAYEKCSEYNVISRSGLPPNCGNYIIPSFSPPRLAGASEKPLQLGDFTKLSVRLKNKFFPIPVVIAERLQVPLVLGTFFADEHVRVHQIQAQRLELVKERSVLAARILPDGAPATR